MQGNENKKEYVLKRLNVTDDGCWESTLQLSKTRNLCMVQLDGKQQPLHRVVWKLWRGDIPRGLQVLHDCGNRLCCNPDHLKVGRVIRGKAKCRRVNKTKEYIQSIVKANAMTGCWECTLNENRNGYVRLRVDGVYYSVHRLAWEIWKGPIVDDDSYHGTCVLHKCDNRKCCNPDHLMLGSHQDNMKDRNNKKRQISLKGESNPLAKIKTSDVITMRELYATGKYTSRNLGEMFGIAKATVSGIIQRRSWKHI